MGHFKPKYGKIRLKISFEIVEIWMENSKSKCNKNIALVLEIQIIEKIKS